MDKRIAILVSFLIQQAMAATPPTDTVREFRELAGGKLTEAALARVTLPLSSPKPIFSVVYGNPTYGFFETREFVQKGSEVQLELFPPGYRLPIQFLIKLESPRGHALAQNRKIHFVSKLPTALHRGAGQRVHGALKSNYLLLTGTAAAEDTGLHGKQSYYYIMNRLGEIVWAYRAVKDGETGLLKFLGHGKYVLETGSHFYFIDSKGRELNVIKPIFLPEPYQSVLRHDFLVQPSGDILAMVRKFAHGFCPSNLFAESSRFAGGALVSINGSSHRMQPRWDSFQTINPVALAPLLHPLSLCQSDGSLTKITSIAEHRNGYILSVVNSYSRTTDKLVLLDPSAKTVIDVIGSDTTDSIRVRSEHDKFYAPYQVEPLSNGNLLFLDRGRSESRVVELKVDTQSKSAAVVKEFRPSPALYSFQRGSAYINGDSVVAYLARSIRPLDLKNQRWIDVLLEFDYETGKETARFQFDYGDDDVTSYRAFPLQNIGTEHFLGLTTGGES